jgi:hypothetical protein
VIKKELNIPLVAVWISIWAEAFGWPPLSSPSLLTLDTVTAVTPELLHSTVTPEVYDAWYGKTEETHPILAAMFAVNQVSSAKGLKIFHFMIVAKPHQQRSSFARAPYGIPHKLRNQEVHRTRTKTQDYYRQPHTPQ